MNFLKFLFWFVMSGASAGLFAQDPAPSALTMVNVGNLIRNSAYGTYGSLSAQAKVADVYASVLPPAAYTVKPGDVLDGVNMNNTSFDQIASGTNITTNARTTGWGAAGNLSAGWGPVSGGGSYNYTSSVQTGQSYGINWNSLNGVSYTTQVDSDGYIIIRYVVKFSLTVRTSRYSQATVNLQAEGIAYTGLTLGGIKLMQNYTPTATPPVIESPISSSPPPESPVSASSTAGNGVFVSGQELGYINSESPVTPYTEVGPLIFVAFAPDSPVSPTAPSYWSSLWDWLTSWGN